MEKVEKNEKMKNFILDMASINGTITMTPVAGLDMDATSIPVAIFAYDSSYEAIHEGMEIKVCLLAEKPFFRLPEELSVLIMPVF